MKIILGSKSPRRAEILSKLAIPFIQEPSHFDEDSVLFQGDPCLYAATLAEKKASQISQKYPDDIIITSDTVVYCNGKIYNKPKDNEEALQFLSELSGTWHQVLTAVCAKKKSECFTEVEETKILFHSLKKEQLLLYIRRFKPLDMAGAYAIQEGGCLLIERMEGCFYNVMGLPINALKNVLLKLGVDIWTFLKKP